jgi:hypothetical protein
MDFQKTQYQKLYTFLIKNDFELDLIFNCSIYIKESESVSTIVYVNDFLILAKSTSIFQKLKKMFCQEFKVTNLRKVLSC